MEVIIAGAGLAGMYAAWLLERAGHDVQVLEASHRVGGRTWSHKLSNGEVVERGGEYIGPDQHLIRRVCAELELPLIPHGIVFNRRWMAEGTRYSTEQLAEAEQQLHGTIDGFTERGRHNASLLDAARETWGNDAYVEHPVWIRIATSLANDPGKVSARGYLTRERGRRSVYLEHGARVLSGNQAITLEIEKRLSKPVLLGHRVTSVQQDAGKVTLETSNGTSFVADFAVIAIPLLPLREVVKDVELPEIMRGAIDARVMGAAAKISAATEGSGPPMGVQYPGALWWTWNSLASDDDCGREAVTAFAGGQRTVEELALEDGGMGWKTKISSYRTDLTISDEIIVTDWTQDPLIGGGYSAPGVAWKPEFATAFEEAAGRIAIAGEHTSESSMNGSLRSGERAANALLRHG
ncbi:flavin monoamine oxidase family protein [Pelagibacterium lacus]|uniref:FAD-binding protein n=1 Tax=Pelagibacterium lacus TaxID=2282655 RepID=A0A369VZG1_9HYPH|nr:FAD-dependent oxidoreductase [Pelagibacterium lacus]RDE07786.1 FAD-binding protein [Pelagibacterium lacus]